MYETNLSLIGYVASDVKFALSNRPDGEEDLSIAKFRVVSTSRKFDKAQEIWVNGDTTFATIVCFRRLAEHVTSSLKRGDPVMVFGKMRMRQWQGEGRSGTELEIIATAVGHNLVLGTAMFSKSLFRVPAESAGESAGEFASSSAGVAAGGFASGSSGLSGSAGSMSAAGSAGEFAGSSMGSGGSVGSGGEDLLSGPTTAPPPEPEPATPLAAVTPLPGTSDIRSVGPVDATGVLPTRPSEERSSPSPTSSPSTTADEQAA